MNNNELFSVGDRIEIETHQFYMDNQKYNDEKKKILVSQVLDIIDDQTYVVATPIFNNVITPIPIGEFIYIKQNKKNEGVFIFKAKVISRKTLKHISCLIIQKIGDIDKDQRRNFFRLEVVLDIQFRQLDQKGNPSGTFTRAYTQDISGGGLRLISNEKIKVGTTIEIHINTGEDTIIAKGRIIRCSLHDAVENTFEIATAFEGINEKTRTQIISFIFHYQRKMRKKGLI
ncbi:MAG: flagellar brake protein [Bacillota bacterium]